MNDFRFKIALSFPGEYRARVENIATLLSASVAKDAILYDRWHAPEFARPNLDVYLPKLYHEQSLLLVFFFCGAYADRQWCGLEWRVGRDLLKQGEDQRIMLLRLDDGKIQGLYSIDGCLDIRDMPDPDVAEAILKRLGSLLVTPAGSTQFDSNVSPRAQRTIEKEQAIAGSSAQVYSLPSVVPGQPTPIRKPKLQLRSNGAQKAFEGRLDNSWKRISLYLANEEYGVPTPAHNVRASMALLQAGTTRRLDVRRCFFLINGSLQLTVNSLERNRPCEVVLAYTNDDKHFLAASSHTPSEIGMDYHLEAALWRCKVKVQSDEVIVPGLFELMLSDDKPVDVRPVLEYSLVEHRGGIYHQCNFCGNWFGSEEAIKNHFAGCDPRGDRK